MARVGLTHVICFPESSLTENFTLAFATMKVDAPLTAELLAVAPDVMLFSTPDDIPLRS